MRRLLLAVLVLLPFAGCAHDSLGQQLRRRAAFELNCPMSKLELQVLNLVAHGAEQPVPPSQYGVEGCGKRVVYVIAHRSTETAPQAD